MKYDKKRSQFLTHKRHKARRTAVDTDVKLSRDAQRKGYPVQPATKLRADVSCAAG